MEGEEGSVVVLRILKQFFSKLNVIVSNVYVYV